MMSNWLAREITYWAESFNLSYVLLVEESLINDEWMTLQFATQPVRQAVTNQDWAGVSCCWGCQVRGDGQGSTRGGGRQLHRAHQRLRLAPGEGCHLGHGQCGHKPRRQHPDGAACHHLVTGQHCPQLSISGTAYYALGLVATNIQGSEALGSIRHCRGDQFTVKQSQH